MDKLEKALEKSRQQRAALAGSVVTDPLRHETIASVGHAPPLGMAQAHIFPATEPEQIDERHMERHRIFAHHVRNPDADIYRILRTQVLHIMSAGGFRTLAITSPHYGDGKTTVAINLGISIALNLKNTVLLADLDLRKPDMHSYLGIAPRAGLTDYLLNDTPLHECFLRPPFERVNTLSAGTPLDSSSELLASPKMSALAQEMKHRYADRLIVYDMPPMLPQDDSLAFLPQVDAVLVVVRDGTTRVSDLKRCLNALSKANVIGTVLNARH